MLKTFVTGRLGRDPELRTSSATGKSFATFSVGVSIGTKANPKTEWVEASCSDKTMEIVMQYCKKGTQVLLEGKPSVNAYINKEGKAVGSLRLSVSNLEMLGGNHSGGVDSEGFATHGAPQSTAAAHIAPPVASNASMVLQSDDVPF
jgi:single-strand DNA-binding protein